MKEGGRIGKKGADSTILLHYQNQCDNEESLIACLGKNCTDSEGDLEKKKTLYTNIRRGQQTLGSIAYMEGLSTLECI